MRIISLLLCSSLAVGSLNGLAPAVQAEDIGTYLESEEAQAGWEDILPGELGQPVDETVWEEEIPTVEDPGELPLNPFPWNEMNDEEFSKFIQSREYLIYSGDYTAMESIKARLELVQDPVLRELLREILRAWPM